MIFRCLGWILLYCLKLTLDSRSHSTKGFKKMVKTIPPREKKEQEVVARVSPIAPCLNGCIGASPMEGKGKGSAVTAGSDSWATSFCLRGKGHEDRQVRYSGTLPMN